MPIEWGARVRGADLAACSLAAAGVRTVFTLSGNQIMPIFDACIDVGIRLIHVRHEAAAVYMADAWSQLTGNPGVALLTAGPGFANGLAPLFGARASESAVVLLSGDAPLGRQGHGAFQELRQADVAAPLCKAAFKVLKAEGLADDLARAFRTARSGRPGPVHLALPFDVLNAVPGNVPVPGKEAFEREPFEPDDSRIGDIAGILARAERPVVLTGPALTHSRAGGLLDRLSAATGAPVIPMESPRGLKDPALGDLSAVLSESDAVLCLGKRVDFTLGFGQAPAFAPGCRFLIVDPEPEALERAKRHLGESVAVSLQADADAVAGALSANAGNLPPRDGWRQTVAAAVALRPESAGELSPRGRMLPAELCAPVQQVLHAADDPILVCDGGEFGQWAQACLSARTRIINGPGGAIGGGLCHAIAAKLCRPGATVVALMGDGTAGFHLSELETALRHGAPIVAVIGHDARWNAEHQIQLRDYGPDRLIGCELGDTRYDQAAAGLGCHGEHVTRPGDLFAALERALNSGLPSCINVPIEGLPAPSVAAH